MCQFFGASWDNVISGNKVLQAIITTVINKDLCKQRTKNVTLSDDWFCTLGTRHLGFSSVSFYLLIKLEKM